jgi:hypothetical protein
VHGGRGWARSIRNGWWASTSAAGTPRRPAVEPAVRGSRPGGPVPVDRQFDGGGPPRGHAASMRPQASSRAREFHVVRGAMTRESRCPRDRLTMAQLARANPIHTLLAASHNRLRSGCSGPGGRVGRRPIPQGRTAPFRRHPRPAVERSPGPSGRLAWDRGSRHLGPHTVRRVRRKSATQPASVVTGRQRPTMKPQVKPKFHRSPYAAVHPGSVLGHGPDVRRPAWPQQIDDDDPGPD